MADKARKWTDKELAKIERNITEIYEQAEKEMKEKWDAYIKRGEKRISAIEKDYRDALKVGDEQIISQQKERLKKAKESFLIKNEQYKAMVDSVTLDMAKTNEEALSYIYSRLPEIYATNFEQAREIIENFDSNLVLPNKNVIKNMVINGDIKTPFMKTDNFIKIPKDQRWNTKFINSEVLQGIIQGEDMRTISNRIFPEIMEKSPKARLSKKELKSLEKRNRNAAIRNARTLVTGAENRGRIDSYKELEEQGAVLKKVWIATGDSRTRDWHLSMDGQEVNIDEPFIDGNDNELEYPADPNGAPETVYNCRCSMRTHVVGFRKDDGSISYVDYEHEEGLHQKEIKAETERREELIFTYKDNPDGLPQELLDIIGYKGEPIKPEELLKTINPNFNDNSYKYSLYHENCQRCATCYELGRRGYDVEALSFNGEYPSLTAIFDNVKNNETYVNKRHPIYTFNRSSKTTANSVVQAMSDWGDGSRATLEVTWRNSQSSHIVNVENINGEIFIFDAQCGKKFSDIEGYLSQTKCAETELYRSDTRPFRTDSLLNYERISTICEKRK